MRNLQQHTQTPEIFYCSSTNKHHCCLKIIASHQSEKDGSLSQGSCN